MFGRLTPVVKNLLLVNIGLFALSIFLYAQLNFDLINLFGLHYVFAKNFKIFQPITYMFMHSYLDPRGGIYMMHIFGNMFALFIFGPLLETFWGSKKFLIFYMVTGIGAGVLFSGIEFFEIYELQQETEAYIENPNPETFDLFVQDNSPRGYYQQIYPIIENFHDNPSHEALIQESINIANIIYNSQANIPMVGASGAIFGILMAFGLLFPNTELFLLFIPFPIKAKYFVTLYGMYEVYALIQRAPGDNVAHLAHLGGMLFAFILVKYWQKQSNNFY